MDISSTNFFFGLGCGLARGAVLTVAGSKSKVHLGCAAWPLVGVERCRL